MGVFSRLFGRSDFIYIHTDKPQYFSGEVVTGQVILSVVDQLRMNGVYIMLSGREESELTVMRTSTTVKPGLSPSQPSTRSETTRPVTFRDSHVFFRQKYCLFSQASVLMGGNYVFPFRFHLSHSLPGTFTMMSTRSDRKGEVRYELAAEVAVPGLLNPNLRHSQQVLVRESLRTFLAASDAYQESKVTFLCCLPRGVVSMSASLDRNAYCPGETVCLRLLIDNSLSQVDLEAASLKLTVRLSLRAQGERASEAHNLCRAKAPGVKAGERAERHVQLTLPSNVEPSTTGQLITCEYTIDAVLKVPWSPDVVCKQSVQIVAPIQESYVPTLVYPEGWQPSIYPVADLDTLKGVEY